MHTRDYTHVEDIAEAHILGLEKLLKTKEPVYEVINLGSGLGYSNLEVLRAVEKTVGQTIRFTIAPRREGDAAHLVADNKKAVEYLGWRPNSSDLQTIVENAYAWHKHNKIYDEP